MKHSSEMLQQASYLNNVAVKSKYWASKST